MLNQPQDLEQMKKSSAKLKKMILLILGGIVLLAILILMIFAHEALLKRCGRETGEAAL